MANLDDEFDKDDEAIPAGGLNKKKILFILVPVLIVIGLVVSFYYIFNKNLHSGAPLSYSIISAGTEEDANAIIVFYDLPEITAQLKDNTGAASHVKMKISVELSRVEDVAAVEAMVSRLTDIIIAHTIELTPDEVSGSNGLYWLKEELLYRMNLVAAPIKITNINFKNFEIQNTKA